MKKLILLLTQLTCSAYLSPMNPTTENPSRASLAYTGIKNGAQTSAVTTVLILSPLLLSRFAPRYSVNVGSKIIQKRDWKTSIHMIIHPGACSGIIGGISGAGLSLTSNKEETVIRRAQVAGTFTGALIGMTGHCLVWTVTALEEITTWIIK